MTKKTRRLLQGLLLLVFLISTVMLLRQYSDNAGGSESYADALQIAAGGDAAQQQDLPAETQADAPKAQWVPVPVENDPHFEEMKLLDIAALQAVNQDVIGWIRIPDSNIDYPLMAGPDNDFYLKHTWDGKENSVGSIFLEHRNRTDFTDYNTIVYGHNMNDGSMFANLKRYSTQWYWERHPYVYIALADGVYRYEVFASYKAPTDSSAYGLSFHQTETKVTFLTEAVKNSQAYTGIEPALTDRILTLSTCSGGGYSHRWVVHARLQMMPSE